MGNKSYVEHQIKLINVLKENSLNTIKEYYEMGLIEKHQQSKLIEFEEKRYNKMVEEQMSYIY